MGTIKSISPYTNYVSKKQEVQPEPKYYCSSCTKCTNSFCSTYNRHVEPDFNKCFNHSNYNPIKAAFKVPDNLLELMKMEEKAYTA